MDWQGDRVNDALAIVRAIHFAATAVVAGTLIFRAVVTEPASHSAEAIAFGKQASRVAAVGLAIAVVSGAIWLPVQAANITDRPFEEAMTTDLLSTVVAETQFGLILEIRIVLAIILAVCLAYDHLATMRRVGLLSALGLVAAIAWTGHAGAGVGDLAMLHLAVDVLHIIAAAAWLGGLVSLVLLFTMVRCGDYAWKSFATEATNRFSNLGIAAVGTLFFTGIVNARILVGSVHALITTEYGRLLALKLALFAGMVAFAAINRFWLTPRLLLSKESATQSSPVGQITRNSLIEIVLGLAIYGIVGVLGTLHPAIHSL